MTDPHDAYAALIVGVDVDGVLAQTVEAVLPHIAHKHNGLTADQIDRFDYSTPSWRLGKEVNRALADDDFLLSIKPHEGAVETMQWLYERFSVQVITGRNRSRLAATAGWLAEYGIPYHNLICTEGESKLNYGAAVIIDDRLDTVREFVAAGRPAILIERPWSKGWKFSEPKHLHVARKLPYVRPIMLGIAAFTLKRSHGRTKQGAER